MTRKILITNKFGAGWVSWFSGTIEQKKFMLEYEPFIKFLEENGNQGIDDDETIEQFETDWEKKFPGVELPYTEGVRNLCVKTIGENELVQISDYDGCERVIVTSDDWL